MRRPGAPPGRVSGKDDLVNDSMVDKLIPRLALLGLALVLALPASLPVDPVDSAKRKRLQTVSRAFTQSRDITIPSSGPATPDFPSRLTVRGLRRGQVLDVELRLRGFSHQIPYDVDILLVKGDRTAVVFSDVGGSTAATDLNITLDDEASTALTKDGQLANGVFRPTNVYDFEDDPFPAPAPAHDGASVLTTFDGLNPNGAWQLFVHDEQSGYAGSLDGWELVITAKVRNKHKKRR
jgi:hypothetical protein